MDSSDFTFQASAEPLPPREACESLRGLLNKVDKFITRFTLECPTARSDCRRTIPELLDLDLILSYIEVVDVEFIPGAFLPRIQRVIKECEDTLLEISLHIGVTNLDNYNPLSVDWTNESRVKMNTLTRALKIQRTILTLIEQGIILLLLKRMSDDGQRFSGYGPSSRITLRSYLPSTLSANGTESQLVTGFDDLHDILTALAENATGHPFVDSLAEDVKSVGDEWPTHRALADMNLQMSAHVAWKGSQVPAPLPPTIVRFFLDQNTPFASARGSHRRLGRGKDAGRSIHLSGAIGAFYVEQNVRTIRVHCRGGQGTDMASSSWVPTIDNVMQRSALNGDLLVQGLGEIIVESTEDSIDIEIRGRLTRMTTVASQRCQGTPSWSSWTASPPARHPLASETRPSAEASALRAMEESLQEH